jgi:hypothetical protein
LFFLLEIIINFNSSFVDEIDEVVDDRKQIFINYFAGWFFVDLLSIIPIEFILLSIADTNFNNLIGGNAQMNKLIRASKFSKIYKFVKIT